MYFHYQRVFYENYSNTLLNEKKKSSHNQWTITKFVEGPHLKIRNLLLNDQIFMNSHLVTMFGSFFVIFSGVLAWNAIELGSMSRFMDNAYFIWVLLALACTRWDSNPRRPSRSTRDRRSRRRSEHGYPRQPNKCLQCLNI